MSRTIRTPVSELLGCRDCGGEVPGKQYKFCAACGRRRRLEVYKRYDEKNAEKRRQERQARWLAVKQDPARLEEDRRNKREYYARNREAWSIDNLRRRHGITPVDVRAMWEAQGGACYLCRRDLVHNEAVIDHDHGCCGPKKSCSRCRRGLAHNACNQLIGLADDSADMLRLIAANLEAVGGRLG